MFAVFDTFFLWHVSYCWYWTVVFGSNTSSTARHHAWWLQPRRTCTKYGSTTASRRRTSAASTSSTHPSRSRATRPKHPTKTSTLDSPPWPCIREYYISLWPHLVNPLHLWILIQYPPSFPVCIHFHLSPGCIRRWHFALSIQTLQHGKLMIATIYVLFNM